MASQSDLHVMNGLSVVMHKLTTNKHRCRHFSALVALLSCLLAGNTAQAFQLLTMNEERVNLLDYVGDDRWTLVMFWATDCIPCEEQKPALEAFHQQHSPAVASVVGVAIDGMENKAGIDKLNALHDPGYPNLVVFTDVFHRQYQELVGKPFRTTPTFLVFDADGHLQGNLYGYIDFEALSNHIVAQN